MREQMSWVIGIAVILVVLAIILMKLSQKSRAEPTNYPYEKIFFRTKVDGESSLYKNLRDNPRALKAKNEIEQLWRKYEPFAHKSFLKKIQIEFHHRWWEMYLYIGLRNLNIQIDYSKSDKGPDYFIPSKKKINIEAVAPKPGNTDDKVPEFGINGVFDFPKNECLLRMSQALESKGDKFIDYISKSTIENDAINVIALSTCALNQFGTMLDFPQPAPLSVLAGAGNLRISKEISDSYSEKNSTISRHTGAPVNMCFFENKKFNIISAVLYSNSDPVNAPESPEETFKLFLNPNAINQIPKDCGLLKIETWQLQNSKSSVDEIWIKA